MDWRSLLHADITVVVSPSNIWVGAFPSFALASGCGSAPSDPRRNKGIGNPSIRKPAKIRKIEKAWFNLPIRHGMASTKKPRTGESQGGPRGEATCPPPRLGRAIGDHGTTAERAGVTQLPAPAAARPGHRELSRSANNALVDSPPLSRFRTGSTMRVVAGCRKRLPVNYFALRGGSTLDSLRDCSAPTDFNGP